MKLTPLHDWAVVRQLDEDEVTAGGLYIPDSAKKKSAEGVVEAIGPGAYEEEKRGRKKKEEKKERKFIATTVKPGDVVLYESYAGREVKVNGEDLVLVRERDILGTLVGRREPKRAPAAPLQIPRATTGQGNASLAPRPSTAVAVKRTASVPATAPAKAVKKAAAKPAKKAAAKKAAPKPVKKAAKKAALKTAKPKASKKAAKKTAKKKR